MILEGTTALIGAYGMYRHLYKNDISNKKIKRNIISKWNTMIETSRNQTENKGEQKFELLDVFPKYYGFDAIVSLPLEYKKLRHMIPNIETTFAGDAIVELATNKRSAYLRVTTIPYDKLQEKDYIKFRWYKTFAAEKFRNSYGQTYKITEMQEIKNPYTEDLVGYRLMVSIPTELNYDDLEKQSYTITESWKRKIVIRWKAKEKQSEVTCIFKELSDDEKFRPVKVGCYDFMMGMNYEYKPIISNLQYNPHLMYTGKTQTGKTVAVMSGITNMAYWYDDDSFLLFESMISAKQDLRIFANLKQCKYYARNIDTSNKLFKHINNIMKERNSDFENNDVFVASMYEWNKKYPSKKMPLILLVIDEMTVYMPKANDTKEIAKKKKECIANLWNLMIEGASAGINVLFALQRPDKDSFPPTIKAQIGTRVSFLQPNTASALTAMDSELCTKLEKKREAYVDYAEGLELMKTLYLTPDMVLKILKHKMEKNKKYVELDDNGRIVKPKTIEKDKQQDIQVNPNPTTNQPQDTTKHEEKQFSRRQQYLNTVTSKFNRNGA